MDRLMECALLFQKMLNKRYIIKIDRKSKDPRDLKLIFDKLHFKHLIGLHYLTDVNQLKCKNSEKIFDKIINGQITYDQISSSVKFQKIKEMVEAFLDFEEVIDSSKKSTNGTKEE